MVQWLRGRVPYGLIQYGHEYGFIYQQAFGLVNVKLKWVKDKALDGIVASEKDLKAVCSIVSIISSDPRSCVPVYHLSRSRGQLGLPHDLKVSTFVRRYPTIFYEQYIPDSASTPVPWFSLTHEALDLHKRELDILRKHQKDLVSRLCKLLMLTKQRTLPLQTIDQLKWDMGLPYDYGQSLVQHHPELLTLCHLPDDRTGLKLLFWDDSLAHSELEKSTAFHKGEDFKNGNLAFPIRFTRGYGLKRKCMQWLEEWQRLPYTSPYVDASHLDSRTDVSEKRIVGVFHEFLHLTLAKKTERKNVSNLRKPLALPQKFTKVFERHPGIFYISKKCGTQTVVLREAYDGQKLICKHPLLDIREGYIQLMRKGFLDRSKGLYKRSVKGDTEKIVVNDSFGDQANASCYRCNGHSDSDLISEYETYESEDCFR